MTLTAVPAPAAGVETAYLDGEAVLYDVRRSRPLLLNPTGSAVWMLIDGESTVTEICETLVEIFGGDPDIVRADVVDLLERFGELGLLEGSACLEDRPSVVAPAMAGGPLPPPPVP